MTHLDQLLVTNILIWCEVFGSAKAGDLKSLGVFNSLERFVETTTELSSKVKRIPKIDPNIKQAICELYSLTGYLQSDIVDTDWRAELKALASGGNKHGGEGWLKQFTTALELIRTPNTQPRFQTFEEYIESGKWVTSGSSSVGKVAWTEGDTHGSFKARKNMLTELYTTQELLDMCTAWDGALTSRGFIKDELSKRRLAVASNIEAYLYESYTLAILGNGYKNWDYITLDENPQQQHERNSGIVTLLRQGAWALPFDFKGFDHQPTTVEIQTIMASTLSTVTVPRNYTAQWAAIKEKIIASYTNSWITMMIGGDVVTERVTGGLPSGVRWTSLFGNQWNAAVTTIARQITIKTLGYDPVLTIGVKGDDTYILARKPVELYIFRLAYQSINAIGLDSKFGISQGICEFLRNEISTTGVRGWACRSIPSITQRKPWNPNPWSPSAAVSTVAENIYTLERRLKVKLPFLHQANKIKWSKHTNQSYLWLHLPKRLGGFGIYEFGGWLPTGKLPLVKPPNLKFSNILPAKPMAWMTAPMSEQQSIEVSNIRMARKAASDDVRGVQHAISKQYLKEIRALKVTWHHTSTTWNVDYNRPPSAPPVASSVAWPRIRETIYWNETLQMGLDTFIQEQQDVARAGVNTSLVEELKIHFPAALVAIRKFEKHGWHRTDAINLAMGLIPTEPTKDLHPLLAPFVAKYVYDCGVERWKGRTNIAQRLYETTTIATHSITTSRDYNMYSY